MVIKKYLKAMPVLAFLLLTAACSSEDNEIIETPQPEQARIVPFTANVSSGSMTRATLDGYNNYKFQETDKLYIWTSDGKVYGELSWVSGKAGVNYDGSFSGNLTVEAGGSLVNGTTQLNAVIKSNNDQILGTLAQFKSRGFVPAYTTAIATSNEEAVQMFSFFKTSAYYFEDGTSFDFNGAQKSTFISFDITLEDGTDAGDVVSVTINNGGSAVRTGSVTTTASGTSDNPVIHAKFVAGFPSGTMLSSASVKVGVGSNISFGASQTLDANKIYNVTKTYTRYKITASATIPTTIANALHISENQSMTTSNKPMNYTTTLQDMLDAMGTEAAMIKTMVSGCTRTSPASDWSVDYSDLEETPKNYQFEVVGEGETVFNMSVTYGVTVNVPITINVEKMTPAD
jgi:hypothetical protein